MNPVPRHTPSYAVIGDPVEHSLSPKIFEWLFQETGLPGRYGAIRVVPEALEATLARVRGGELSGLSVTLPHKEAALRLVDALHPLAERIGALNCVMPEEGGTLRGYNTDAIGFRRALEEQGARLAGSRVVLLGAGGAGRSAAFAAREAGARSIVIANRSLERAERLVSELQIPTATAVPLTAGGLGGPLAEADLLVNATRVGLLAPEESPLPGGFSLKPGLWVNDMVYRPLETALLRQARESGATVIDGLWMLIHQALEQLRIWTGYAASPNLAERLYRHVRKEIA